MTEEKRKRTLRLPLTACALVALLWPLSFFFRARVYARIDHKEATFFVGPEYLSLNVGTTSSDERMFTTQFQHNTAHDRDFLGAPMVFTTTNSYTFWFPLSLLVASATIFAAGYIASHYRHLARFKPGGCPRCGYDLRATPDRCPECGHQSTA